MRYHVNPLFNDHHTSRIQIFKLARTPYLQEKKPQKSFEENRNPSSSLFFVFNEPFESSVREEGRSTVIAGNSERLRRAPVRLETSLSVKSSIVTKEEVTVARGGKVVDERSRETKENNYYASSTSEIWEPVGIVHRPRNIKPFDSSDESRPNSNASSDQGYTTNTSSNHVLREASASSTVGCPICEDNDPDCARRCLGGLAGLGTKVQTTNSAVSDSPFRFDFILKAFS